MEVTCASCGAVEGVGPHNNTCPEHPDAIKRRLGVRIEGQVRKINSEKLYGFARPTSAASDHFFHRDDCVCDFNDLKEGMYVSFDTAEGVKGLRAVALDIIGKEN